MGLMGECNPSRIQDSDGPTGFVGPAVLFEPIGVNGSAGTFGEIVLVGAHDPSGLQKPLELLDTGLAGITEVMGTAGDNGPVAPMVVTGPQGLPGLHPFIQVQTGTFLQQMQPTYH